MKRFRVFDFDIDTRATILTEEIQDAWEEAVKETHRAAKQQLNEQLLKEYGSDASDVKLRNFVDLGSKPLSITAFHNKFLEQIRTAFIMGAYYPALTASCALGERILNHLIILLRDDFSTTPQYKRVYKKNSFDDWDKVISVLESWQVLLPGTTKLFRELATIRHRTIHFHPETDENDRDLSLGAIQVLSAIISEQFPAFGRPDWVLGGIHREQYLGAVAEPNSLQWFITGVPGEIYLKKDLESNPFIKRVYIPKSFCVGPRHQIQMGFTQESGWIGIIDDRFDYESREITDEEFVELRKAARDN